MSAESGVAFIALFVIYPFAITGISIWIDAGRERLSNPWRMGLMSDALFGIALSVVLMNSDQLSKYWHVDLIAAFVLVMSTAATGTLIGSLVSRYQRTNTKS